jgi:hypothetical protein
MTNDELWNIFLMDRPDLAGSRHDDPDPENKVWPAFVEWRDQMRSHPDIIHRRLPEETRLAHRLRTGHQHARDDGMAETLWTVFQAENPGFLDRAAGDLRTAHEREQALRWAREKAIEEAEGDELLPVTRRLLSGGVE